MKWIALISVFFCQHAFALSCLEPKLEDYVKENFIVRAQVTKILKRHESGFNQKPDRYEVQIKDYIKGESDKEKTIVHMSTWYGNPRLDKDGEYIFFTDDLDKISVSACGFFYQAHGDITLEQREAEIRAAMAAAAKSPQPDGLQKKQASPTKEKAKKPSAP